MATRLEKIALEDGGYILIEAYEVEGEVRRVGVSEKAAKTFEAAWTHIQPVIQSLSRKMAELAPTEAQVTFGVKIGTDLEAIIASATGEANFEVTLTWKQKD